MSEKNKATLTTANAAMAAGDAEGFLQFCTEDIEWGFVGDRTIHGKAAVRQWIAETYGAPPRFTMSTVIAEGDELAVVGEITVTDTNGKSTDYSYCDVWRFRDGKLAQLRAFAIEKTS